jgi:hypothetical protein
MKVSMSILGALVFLMVATTSFAQNVCATQFGFCAMNVPGVPGGPCYCVTQAGAIQGITQGPSTPIAAGAAPDPFPHFCCTPAGRIGPFQNTAIGPGQACSAPTPAGLMMAGQACF